MDVKQKFKSKKQETISSRTCRATQKNDYTIYYSINRKKETKTHRKEAIV